MSATTHRFDPDSTRMLLRAALAGGALWLAWRALRGLRSVFWTLFGLGMAAFWVFGWRFFA